MKGNENMHINLPKKGNKTNLLKKSLALILSGAVTIPLIVPGNNSGITDRSLIYAEADNVTYGDVNSDGKISILDMIALKSYITEKNSKEFSVKAADESSFPFMKKYVPVEITANRATIITEITMFLLLL